MRKNQIFLFCCCLFFVACNSEENYSPDFGNMSKATNTSTAATATSAERSKEAMYEMEDQEMTEESMNGEGATTTLVDRKIIKTADYRMEVEDVKATYDQVAEKVKNHGGYVVTMNQTNNRYQINNHLTIRVPQDKFDPLLVAISEFSIFEDYQRITASDVTAEYLDVETRLENKKLVRDRYIDVLKNKAKTVKEIILAEETIRRIQEEIEAKEGRLKYLKSQTSLSTINLDMYQTMDRPRVAKRSFFGKIQRGLENGWELCLDIILGLVNIWPLVLLFILLIWKRSWIWSKLKRK